MAAALLVASLLAAPELEDLLARGPVVAVQTGEKGKFDAAVGQVEILAPIDKVWAAVSGFAQYKEFMPRVVESRLEGQTAEPRVQFEIESPGVNTRYTVQYKLDPKQHLAEGRQVSGDLAGSTWRWELVELQPGRTRVRYVSRARNLSRVLAALEDDAQTITTGINVAGVITVLRAMKRRCEE